MYWLLGDGPPRIIEEVAVPMPGAESAQVAEAHAAAEAVCRADQVSLKHGVPIGDEELLIVGDSDMVTRCIRGRAREKALDVNQAHGGRAELGCHEGQADQGHACTQRSQLGRG